MKMNQKEYVYMPTQNGLIIRKHVDDLTPAQQLYLEETQHLNYANLADRPLIRRAFQKLWESMQ